MAVELELEHRRLVDELVAAGVYASEAEVVSVGLELVREREQRLAELDAALEASVVASKAGRTRPADEVFDELEAYIKGKLAERAPA